MLAIELSAVVRGTPTSSGSLTWCAGWNVLPGCNGDVNRPTIGVLGWKSAVGCIVVAEVGVG
jgi:hypothetical protein